MARRPLSSTIDIETTSNNFLIDMGETFVRFANAFSDRQREDALSKQDKKTQDTQREDVAHT